MSDERDVESAAPNIRVVVNDEEQYSVWWCNRELPLGWRETGYRGSEEDCLSHIAEVWTDMRPKSLRQAMAQTGPTVTANKAGDG